MTNTTIITAEYPGVCGDCHERFAAGTPIIRDEVGEFWAHLKCPDPLAMIAPVCAECFTTKPCGCDD